LTVTHNRKLLLLAGDDGGCQQVPANRGHDVFGQLAAVGHDAGDVRIVEEDGGTRRSPACIPILDGTPGMFEPGITIKQPAAAREANNQVDTFALKLAFAGFGQSHAIDCPPGCPLQITPEAAPPRSLIGLLPRDLRIARVVLGSAPEQPSFAWTTDRQFGRKNRFNLVPINQPPKRIIKLFGPVRERTVKSRANL
jgi:hypothetical protein